MKIRTDTQPPVPGSIGKGDRVQFKLHDDDSLTRIGTVLDVLSTQFLIDEDDSITRVVHFNHVLPVIKVALP